MYLIIPLFNLQSISPIDNKTSLELGRELKIPSNLFLYWFFKSAS